MLRKFILLFPLAQFDLSMIVPTFLMLYIEYMQVVGNLQYLSIICLDGTLTLTLSSLDTIQFI